MLRLAYILVFCILFDTIAVSQHSYWEASYGLGVSTYWGDLNTNSILKNFTNVSVGGQVYAQYNRGRFLGIRGSLLISKLKGDDARAARTTQVMRNLRFFSPLVEMAIMMEYNLFGFDPKDDEQKFSPTLYLGLAGFAFNPKTEFDGTTVALQPLGTEGQGIEGFDSRYKRVQIAVPIGGGIKIKLRKNLSFGLEMIARFTLTDYIDDISTRYVDFDVLQQNNGRLSAVLSERQDEFLGQPEGSFSESTRGTIRGGPDTNDYYITLIASLRYNLGPTFTFKNKYRRGAHCPKF